jgi:hypothetical protein
MFKNIASQSVTLYAVDASTGLAKAGDSANMVFYVAKDDGTLAAIAAASGVPTEVDATNDKGSYKIALAQAETNADKLRFSGKSSTANVVVVPQTIYTVPANFTAQAIDSNGRVDVIKVAGTTQTARDLGASVLLSVGTGAGQVNLASGKVPATLASTDVTGNVACDLQTIKTQAVTAAAGVTFPASIGTSTYAGADTSGTTTLLSRIGGSITISGGKVAATVATGDDADAAAIKTTIGVAGAGLTAVGDTRLAHLDADVSSRSTYAGADTSGTTTLLARLTSGRATNLDNLDAAVSTRLATSGYTAAPTSSVVAAAVWDLATSGHTTSGTFGAAMNAAGSAGDPWATALPGSYGSGTAGNIVGNRIDAAVSAVPAAVWASGTRTLSAFAFSVTASSVTDKTGYSLAAAGLDAISTTAPAGVASNFREMMVQTWRRFFRKATRSATQILTYADNGTSVLTTQAISDDGAGAESQGAAS